MTSIGIIGITRKYGSAPLLSAFGVACLLLSGVCLKLHAQPPQRPNIEGIGEQPINSADGSPASSPSATAPNVSAPNVSASGAATEMPATAGPANSSAPLGSPSPTGMPNSQDAVDPEAVVRRAIWQAVWGDPVASRVRQRISMYGKELVGVGSYCHAGKGSNKLKWQMRFAAADAVTNYLQISDGRLLWTSQQVEEKIQVKRVDLDPIRERIGSVRESDLANPLLAMELAVGGQAELLRSLYHRYDWESAVPTKIDQQPVWLLTGEIRRQAPIPSARAPIDQAMLSESKTGLLPQRVRLALGRTEQFPFFPYRIEYFRRKEAEGNATWEQLTVVEFFEVSTPVSLEPELFQYEVRETVEAIQDETANYLPASPLHLTRQPEAKTR
jgi:hypothetical protein